MSIPMLGYAPFSQNHRVDGFEVPGEEHPRVYTTDNLLNAADFDLAIAAAYRQIFHEQQMLAHHRERCLESQLRAGQINIRDFIRGLLLSNSFRQLTFDANNNYRFAEICIQRVLGRNVYSDREKIAWSIVIATRGIKGFIDDLLSSDEYLDNFGENIIPYHRRRILPQRTKGELPFERMSRYDQYHLAQIPRQVWQGTKGQGSARLNYLRWEWQKNPSPTLVKVGQGILFAGVATIGLMTLSVLFGF
jgi:phycobilisome rod-core linker protein